MPKGLSLRLSSAAAAELGRQAAVAGTPGLMHLDLLEGDASNGCSGSALAISPVFPWPGPMASPCMRLPPRFLCWRG